jgi:hypothetical protein
VYCHDDSFPTLTNCIVWGNTPESLCGNASHCFTGRDPIFVRNGVFDFDRFVTVEIEGETYELPDFILEEPDYHLRPRSPAIDAGTCVVDYDIENNRRPFGGSCDIGAYEYGAPPAARFIRTDTNTDNAIDIADAIFTLSYLFASGPAPSCEDAADANDDGALDLADGVYLLQNLFASGPAIPPPYPDCSIDPSMDSLGCASFPSCE